MVIKKNPRLTVDVIIEHPDGVVLVERRHEPLGWARPGGFVEEGETLEEAAIREASEETGLEIVLRRQFHAYSDPRRDPRGHTVTVVFIASAQGIPRPASDARATGCFLKEKLPPLAFDHAQILRDYFSNRY